MLRRLFVAAPTGESLELVNYSKSLRVVSGRRFGVMEYNLFSKHTEIARLVNLGKRLVLFLTNTKMGKATAFHQKLIHFFSRDKTVEVVQAEAPPIGGSLNEAEVIGAIRKLTWPAWPQPSSPALVSESVCHGDKPAATRRRRPYAQASQPPLARPLPTQRIQLQTGAGNHGAGAGEAQVAQRLSVTSCSKSRIRLAFGDHPAVFEIVLGNED